MTATRLCGKCDGMFSRAKLRIMRCACGQKVRLCPACMGIWVGCSDECRARFRDAMTQAMKKKLRPVREQVPLGPLFETPEKPNG